MERMGSVSQKGEELTVTVRRLEIETVDVMRITMAKEIESGDVKLYGTRRPTSATFFMQDPAKWVGELSIEHPQYSYLLLMLVKKINRAMQNTVAL